MRIKNIELKNYRNYDNLNINFNDNLNIIIGDNAQGKTNLLESIYVLAVTKSFLSNNDKSIIKFNNHYTKINGLIEGKYNVLAAFNNNIIVGIIGVRNETHISLLFVVGGG